MVTEKENTAQISTFTCNVTEPRKSPANNFIKPFHVEKWRHFKTCSSAYCLSSSNEIFKLTRQSSAISQWTNSSSLLLPFHLCSLQVGRILPSPSVCLLCSWSAPEDYCCLVLQQLLKTCRMSGCCEIFLPSIEIPLLILVIAQCDSGLNQ